MSDDRSDIGPRSAGGGIRDLPERPAPSVPHDRELIDPRILARLLVAAQRRRDEAARVTDAFRRSAERRGTRTEARS